MDPSGAVGARFVLLSDRGVVAASDDAARRRARLGVSDLAALAGVGDREQAHHIRGPFAEPLLPRTPLVLPSPEFLRVRPGSFEFRGADGGDADARLTPVELAALVHFVEPRQPGDAFTAHQAAEGALALGLPSFRDLVDRMLRIGVLAVASPRHGTEESAFMAGLRAYGRLVQSIEGEYSARSQQGERVRVVPVQHNGINVPLALGMITAYCQSAFDGELNATYEFMRCWLPRRDRISSLTERGKTIFLFSSYIWSSDENLGFSAAVKEIAPAALTIHGGPNVPRRRDDIEAFFALHPHVDVVVRGEGEATTAEILRRLQDTAPGEPFDLARLHGVHGTSYRVAGQVVHNPDRDRLADLDVIPSPYLSGLFEAYAAVPQGLALIETNRGCPYGCTFCDWGSATLSRIRKFDLERVLAELDWCASHHFETVFVVDANFGIFERDVAIAEHVAQLRSRYGYPRHFGTNFAKNTVRHLTPIIRTLVDAGVFTEGLVSLQTTDRDTLAAIERSNIKVEKYDEVARTFRSLGLPLYVDLMLGLPGSTPDAFHTDLQACVDHNVNAKIHKTEVLLNSPMNDPAYRERHRIETAAPVSGLGVTGGRPALVVSTSTFTRAEYEQMDTFGRQFLLFENFGVFRLVARYVRSEMGMTEVDLYRHLADLATDGDRWPHLHLTAFVLPEVAAPPGSWHDLMDEARLAITALGVPDDPALQSVLRVQADLLPSRRRTYPLHYTVPHDVVSWHASLTGATPGDEQPTPRPLRLFGPGSISIDDPFSLSRIGLGVRVGDSPYDAWELDSPLARPVSRHLLRSAT